MDVNNGACLPCLPYWTSLRTRSYSTQRGPSYKLSSSPLSYKLSSSPLVPSSHLARVRKYCIYFLLSACASVLIAACVRAAPRAQVEESTRAQRENGSERREKEGEKREQESAAHSATFSA